MSTLPDPHSIPIEQIDVSNPYLYRDDLWRPYFERLRREAPLHYCASSAFGPYWSVTGYEDIAKVDMNHADFSSEPTIIIGDIDGQMPLEMFIAMDPPRHDVQRAAVQHVVAPANLSEMESLIRQRVCSILDGLPVGETFDLVERVSIELTTQMLATLFGFPFEERRKLTRWSDVAVGTPEMAGAQLVTPEARRVELMECLATFTRLWHQRQGQPRSFDLISLLQHGEGTSDMVERPTEFLGNILLLIVGGNDTTRNSISGGVLALNTYPEEYEKLRGNPGLIPNMVSEIIRWQTPLAHMRRRATRDIEMHGQTIKAGDKVVMWYLSANRDESKIKDPERLIIDRPNARQHLSFGFGLHRCMGNRLAEMQLRIFWEEAMKRFRQIEVVGEPVRCLSNFVHGYEHLPVRVHPW